MDAVKKLATFLFCLLIVALSVNAAQPALPTTLYGRVTYTNESPAEGFFVTASWIDNNGAQKTSIARTLTQAEAESLGQSGFAGYYFFNQGYLQAQQNTIIILLAEKSVNQEKIHAKPGGEAVLAPSLLLPDINDKTPPSIAAVQFNQHDASVSFSTNELATATVRYGKEIPAENAHNSTLSISHKVVLGSLQPFTDYKFEVIATDVSGNQKVDSNNGNFYSFTTGSPAPTAPTPNIPGSKQSDSGFPSTGALPESGDFEPTEPTAPDPNTLPTSIYGKLSDESGSPVEDATVKAEWTDAVGKTHEETATTLNAEDAAKLGNPGLAGYYFFSHNLTLPTGTDVGITSPNSSYQARAISNPGGASQAVITQTFTTIVHLPPSKTVKQADAERSVMKLNVENKLSLLQHLKNIIAFLMFVLVVLAAAFSFRHYLLKPKATSAEKQLRHAITNIMNAKAREIMKKNVVSADINDRLDDTVKLLLEKDVEGVIVLRNGMPVGWLLEETLMRDVLLKKKSLSSTLKDATLIPLTLVKPDSTVFESAWVLSSTIYGKGAVVEGSRLLGVITLTDISEAIDRFYSRHVIESESLANVAAMMSENVLFVERTDSVVKVAQLMDRNKVDYAIVDGSTPAIVTARDILGEIYINKSKIASTQVSFVAKAPIKTILPYINAFEANRIMLKSFKHIPVLRQAHIKGLLSQEAVVSALIEYLKRISSLLESGSHISVEEK